MFGYYGPPFVAVGGIFDSEYFFGLPEEIRAAVEAKRDDIHSADDLQRVVEELKLKN